MMIYNYLLILNILILSKKLLKILFLIWGINNKLMKKDWNKENLIRYRHQIMKILNNQIYKLINSNSNKCIITKNNQLKLKIKKDLLSMD